MVPLCAARLEDLAPDDLVELTCACGHMMALAAGMLRTAGVKPAERLLDLEKQVG
jgi:hypothetical protein